LTRSNRGQDPDSPDPRIFVVSSLTPTNFCEKYLKWATDYILPHPFQLLFTIWIVCSWMNWITDSVIKQDAYMWMHWICSITNREHPTSLIFIFILLVLLVNFIWYFVVCSCILFICFLSFYLNIYSVLILVRILFIYIYLHNFCTCLFLFSFHLFSFTSNYLFIYSFLCICFLYSFDCLFLSPFLRSLFLFNFLFNCSLCIRYMFSGLVHLAMVISSPSKWHRLALRSQAISAMPSRRFIICSVIFMSFDAVLNERILCRSVTCCKA
jgi:hypothetical protein